MRILGLFSSNDPCYLWTPYAACEQVEATTNCNKKEMIMSNSKVTKTATMTIDPQSVEVPTMPKATATTPERMDALLAEYYSTGVRPDLGEVTQANPNGPTKAEGATMQYMTPTQRMTELITAMMGIAPDPSLDEDRNHNPATMKNMHYQVVWNAIEVPMQGMGDAVAYKIVHGPVEPMATMEEPMEHRIDLSAILNERYPDMIEEFSSFSMVMKSEKLRNIVMNDATLPNKFQRLIESLDMTFIGGTSLNKGTFYGIRLKDGETLGFTKAHESIGYLGLLRTPLKYVIDREDLRVLVVRDSEIAATGLKGDDGNILGGHTVGQIRAIVGGNMLVKGVMMSYDFGVDTLKLDIPLEWRQYDMVVGIGDVKVNSKTANGKYRLGEFPTGNAIGITEDNIWNIRGQAVAYGFEPLQFMQMDTGFLRLLNNRLSVNALPTHEEMVLGAETRRQFIAALNGEEYNALELSSKIQEGLAAFGPEYPWVAQKLGGVVVNHIMNRPVDETAYRIGIVVTDEHARKINALREPVGNQEADKLLFKFPIVAGIAKVVGKAHFGPFTVTAASLAKKLNTDSDGDGVVVQDGVLAQYILASDVLDELKDIKIPKLARRTAAATTVDMARQAVHIWKSSALIGQLTMLNYRAAIYNKVMIPKMHEVSEERANGGSLDEYRTMYGLDESLVFELIELVIKGAKHKTEEALAKGLTAMSQVYTAAVKTMLVETIPMPWSKRAKKDIMGKFNDAVNTYSVQDMQGETTEVVHYMDFIWNANLKRCKVEIDKLESNTRPLNEFARMIPMFEHDGGAVERKELSSLRTAWGELRPALNGKAAGLATDHASTVLAALSVVSKTHTMEARAIISQQYLDAVRGGNGGFIVHLNHGSLVELTQNVDTIVKDNGQRLVRLYTNDLDEGDTLTFEDMDYIKLEDDKFVMPNGEFGDVHFKLADDYEIPEGEVIVDAMPLMMYKPGKNGVPGGTVLTKSAWIVLGPSDS